MPFPGEFEFVSPPDPLVVPYPGNLNPITSIFITSRNQPPPPVLATRVFPPPLWPLPPEDQTIEPVVGPIMALTPHQIATPPGFGTFFPIGASGVMLGERDPNLHERAVQHEEARREIREDRAERRRRRNGDRDRDAREGSPGEWSPERRE
jgi:hypothetical protein